MSWTSAKTQAASMSFLGNPGRLATITSQAENDFVVNNLPLFVNSSDDSYWLGGFQPTGSPEPAGGWQWITGEPWAYTNWRPGEPNNFGNIEDSVEMFSSGQNGKWNDLDNSDLASHQSQGFIVEFPVPEPAASSLLLLAVLILRWRQPATRLPASL